MKYLYSFVLFILSATAYPLIWQDWWVTPDQQGQRLMDQKKFKQAEKHFQQSEWRAVAAYRAGDYQQALKVFQGMKTELGYYNKGNTLAYLGQYEQAIQAYEQALDLNPANKNAYYNRRLLKKLVKNNKKKPSTAQAKQQHTSQTANPSKNPTQNDKNQSMQPNKSVQNSPEYSNKQTLDQQQDKRKSLANNSSQNANKKQQKAEPPTLSAAQKAKKNQQMLAKREQKQANEQWLRLIPDDPGGLMREKFLRDHLRRQQVEYR